MEIPDLATTVRARRALTGLEGEEPFEFQRGSKNRIGKLHKIRFAGKMDALDSLAKHLGMLHDRQGAGR
jgi:hypothetical protein